MTTFLEQYTPSPWQIDHVNLHVNLFQDHALIRSKLSLRQNEQSPVPGGKLRLNGENQQLIELLVDGIKLTPERFHLEDEVLTIAGLPAECELEIVTRSEPQNNRELSGLYRSGSMYCTQCEAEGFRRITFFLDRPDVMARYTTTIEADEQACPVLLSNGNLVRQEKLPGGRHVAVWEDPFRKPCYLFALVAGKLSHIEDHHTTSSGRCVTLRIYTEAHNAHRCDFAMTSLKQAMRWDEETFGREYDLDLFNIVAVDDFNMGAMENKGLNIFNSTAVLARPDCTTDENFARINSVVAHEYFHNWSGNRVTCRDWFQLTLKEGLTVLREQLFSADMYNEGVIRMREVDYMRSVQFPEDAGPTSHPIQPRSYLKIDNFYTPTVYEKGAEVIRMIRTLLGTEAFRKGMDLYFSRHDGTAATTEDFVRAMEDASGRDLKQFRRWYQQAGTPTVTISEDWNCKSGEYSVHVKQEQPERDDYPSPGPLHIPLAIGLLDADGNELPCRLTGDEEMPVGTRVLELRDEEQTFTFAGLPQRPVLSPLRAFSAPVILQHDCPMEELAFRFANDNDQCARWDAGNQLMLRAVLAAIREHQQGHELRADTLLVETYGRTLAQAFDDPFFYAEALRMPTYAVIGQHLNTIDVQAINAVLRFYGSVFADAHRDTLLELVDRCRKLELQDNLAEQHNAHAMGLRSLRNGCLTMLMETPSAEYQRMCYKLFADSANMTDAQAALSVLNHVSCEEREQAFQEFDERWRKDNLVMNSWFRLQAFSRLENTLDRVDKLREHPAYDEHNPNKVRALVAGFSTNHVRFHAADGSGYRFLTERVLEADQFNAQLGSQLVRPLARWRRYGETQGSLMRQQLERIKASVRLSDNVREIVTRALR